jgi:LacI family transcriptional regulator
MGFRAATALFDLIENSDSGSVGLLPATVQLRDSVAPPAGAAK